jgi:hypothetical protein
MPKVRFRIRTIMIAIAGLALVMGAVVLLNGFCGARVEFVEGQLCLQVTRGWREGDGPVPSFVDYETGVVIILVTECLIRLPIALVLAALAFALPAFALCIWSRRKGRVLRSQEPERLLRPSSTPAQSGGPEEA